MAAKGVNLLPEDDDGQDNDELEDEYDDLDEDISSRSRRSHSNGGSGIIRIIGIAFAVLILFGGAAWAGYQFWWIPSLQKEQKKIEARKRLGELRKRRIEQAKAERERREKEMALLQKIRAEAEGITAEKPAAQRDEKKKAGKPTDKAAKQLDGAKKSVGVAKSSVATIKKNQPRAAKEIPQKEVAQMKAAEPAKKTPGKPELVSRHAAKAPEMKSTPKVPVKKVKKSSKVMALPAKPGPTVKAKAVKEAKIALKKTEPVREVAKKNQRFYSIQVATCRKKKCITAFVRKLNQKGFRSRVSGRIYSAAPRTEVLLDKFDSKKAALPLTAIARKKNIRITLYRRGSSWRVSAGSFANIEDAAQRLDQVEDAGLKAKLTAQPGSGRTVFRTVRTGKLATRKSAIAMRKRIIAAGFIDSFVVLQNAQE